MITYTYLTFRKAILYARREATSLAYSIVNVRLFPPKLVAGLLKTVEIFVLLSLALSIISPLLIIVNGKIAMASAMASTGFLLLSYSAPRIVRIAIGVGVDREVPALLAYSLPYASSTRYLVDVLVSLPRRGFTWSRLEASRLSYLLELGLDPLRALEELAETTPSKRLRQVLLDYLHAQRLGAPKSATTLRLVEWALNEIRGAWRSYMEFGRGLVEAVTAAIVAGVAVAPLALLAGNVNVTLYLVPLIASPIIAILLLAGRPEIGDYRGSLFPITLGVSGVLTASAAGAVFGWMVEIALLAVFTVLVELLSVREGRRERAAFDAFRQAVEEARYGARLEDALKRASKIMGGVATAILEAVRVAGRIGVGEALSNLLRVVGEARAARQAAMAPAMILAILAGAAPSIAVYIMVTMANISGGEFLAGDPRSLAEAARLIVALSPMAPLPASVLARGWRPTLVPSLAAFVAAQAILSAKLSP